MLDFCVSLCYDRCVGIENIYLEDGETIVKKINHRLRYLFAATGAVFSVCAWGLPVHAAEDAALEFEIELEGTQIENSDYYGGAVDVHITLPRDDEQLSLWINDAGVWKLIPPSDDHQNYTLSFSENGEYDLQFRAEDAGSLNTFFKDIQFSISTILADAIPRIAALPDEDAEDRDILSKKAEIVAVQNLVNGLHENVRAELSSEQIDRVTQIRTRLSALEPGEDYTPPSAPTVTVSGESIRLDGLEYVAAPVDLLVRGAGSGDAVMINSGEGWSDLPGEGGSYRYTIEESGHYRLDFCLEDSSGNRSEATSVELMVDPDIPALVDELDRLYRSAQTLSQNEYISSLETLYLQYTDFSSLRRSLVPTLTLNRLQYMHDSILEAIGYKNQVIDESGHFIRAIGMYSALDIPALYIGSSDVVFHAQRAASPTPPEGVSGEVFAEYNFSFACENMGENDLEIDAEHPIRICIQVPEDLKGKRNVKMLYVDEDGQTTSTDVKVRSTEENLVLYFDITHSGRYLFVADSVA